MRPIRLLHLAPLLAFALAPAACTRAGDAPADSAAASPGTPAPAPAASGVPMPAPTSTSGAAGDQIEIAGITFTLPPQHVLRLTGGAADHRLYAVAPASDTMATLLEFYLGDHPDFAAAGTKEVAVNGLVARDRVARVSEGHFSREVLIELRPTAASAAAGQVAPSRLHAWYNRLETASAARADAVIGSVRCCVAPGARKVPRA